MKIDKEFIKILSEGREMAIGEILEDMGILDVDSDTKVVKNFSHALEDRLISIVTTADYLENEGLIEKTSRRVPFDVIWGKDQYFHELIEGKEKLNNMETSKLLSLESLWEDFNLKYKIKPAIYSYINNKYLTQQERHNAVMRVVPIMAALFAGATSAILTLLSTGWGNWGVVTTIALMFALSWYCLKDI